MIQSRQGTFYTYRVATESILEEDIRNWWCTLWAYEIYRFLYRISVLVAILKVLVKQSECIMELKLVDIQSKNGTEFALFVGYNNINMGTK